MAFRRGLSRFLACVSLGLLALAAAELCPIPASLQLNKLQLAPPTDSIHPAAVASWLGAMQLWRESCRASLRLDPAIYSVPGLGWTQTAYMQPLAMPFDRYFYNDSRQEYSVDRYLDSLEEAYGGVDAVLLWPTYTNIGADDRSQFEMIQALPGGEPALRKVVGQLHARGVHVLWPYNPWDQGTNGGHPTNSTAAGAADAARLASLLSATDSDGFFGDTISSSGLEKFYEDSVASGRPAAIQPEAGGTLDSMNYTTIGWGYWGQVEGPPPVDLLKWIEPRWMTQPCARWEQDKNNWLQTGYFNGAGFETWQNIWGIWNGITAHDGEALRRVGSILRFFGSRGFLTSAGWRPHDPLVGAERWPVYGSAWPVGDETVWTMVNRGANQTAGPLLAVAANDTRRYWDCYGGAQLQPSGGAVTVVIEARGYGCILATPNATLDAATAGFMQKMRQMTAGRPLAGFSTTWAPLPQTIRPIPPTAPHSETPAGMVEIPAVPQYQFVVQGEEIEGVTLFQLSWTWNGQRAVGVDVQFPWEQSARPWHAHNLSVPRFFIDRTPVTRAAYQSYLQESGYAPADSHNYLQGWSHSAGQWIAPAADLQKPVTHVSLDEARKYCRHYGKRLPHTWEWQLAAQGTDGRKFPWGNDLAGLTDGVRCPRVQNSTNGQAMATLLSNVTAHPQGASPYGVMDMVGNVWQYTDEFSDVHTRAVLLRGGSVYYPRVPAGQNWYFPNSDRSSAAKGEPTLAMRDLSTHGKYFLMSDSYERAGTIGFRCAAD